LGENGPDRGLIFFLFFLFRITGNPGKKSWFITINGSDDYVDMIRNYFSTEDNNLLINRVVAVHDVAPSTGQLHVHCMITFKKTMRFNAVKALFSMITGVQANVQGARSTKAAYKYCYDKNDNDMYEVNNGKQGHRSDLELAADFIKGGGSLAEVASEFPSTFIRYHRGLKEFRSTLLQPNVGKPTVIWAYGRTGLGKSRDAALRFPSACRITTIAAGRFFTSYAGQKEVILDDLRASDIRFSFLLNLLDYGAMYVELKGSEIPWCAEIVYITTERDPFSFYSDDVGDKHQLLRRIDYIYQYNEDTVEVRKNKFKDDFNF
jgi:hypothetical protein